jgi:tripartite-type tricarboxylate transporter receptor subunit TctC
MTVPRLLAQSARGAGRIVLACLLMATTASAATAQTYPNRPIRMIVPAAAGGALDTISRLLAHKVSEISQLRIYIENKPGANWVIGMDAAAKAAPDGTTLLFIASSGLTIVPFVYSSLPVNPLKDLTPVTLATGTPYVLLVNPAVPAKSVSEFVTVLRANPGKLNHASNSATTILVSELFKAQARIDYVDVNFRGASEALTATQAGTTQFCFVDLGSGSGAIAGKMLRPLALTTPQRYPLAPDIPTFAENGLPGVSASSMTLIAAPAKISRDIVNTLNGKFRQALASPDVTARLRSMGQVVTADSPEDAAQTLAREARQWGTLIKQRNIHFGN